MCLPITPYKVEREWKFQGLSCAVVQNSEAGNRCGYVRVPPGHQFFGKHYDDVDVSVHGGLTFAEIEPCTEHEDGQGWWFGFDCAHYMDTRYDPSVAADDPGLSEYTRISIKSERERKSRFPREERGHFWTESEVVAETERLAAQLAA